MPTEVLELGPKRRILFPKNEIEYFTYRKLGADVSSNAKHARLTPAYERRKNIDVICAIVFMAPMRRTH